MWNAFRELMTRGGPVMWVLLALSVLSVTLMFERAWFWVRTNSAGRLKRVAQINRLLRGGDRAGAKVLAEADESVYGKIARALLEEPVTEATALEIIESQRSDLERYLSLLSTIVTAGPLLGLLGTVVGLINTFRFLSNDVGGADPRSVSLGLSEALLNTAAGLIVAVAVLFPLNAFRVQVDRTLGRLESLAAAALKGNQSPLPKGERGQEQLSR